MSSTDHLVEIESLRSQVADLSRALAERERSMSEQRHHFDEAMQDLRERSQLLRTVIEGTAAETGEEFFAALVNHLTSALHVQYAVIGEVSEGQPKKIRTLAVSAGGTLADNFEYELACTPCATVLAKAFACFDRDVQGTFPQFQRLADLGAESYCGVPLRTKSGVVRGLLVVMDTKPLRQGEDIQALLEVFAPRVAAEFERRRAEQEGAQALADLHNVMETVPDILFTLDTQGNMVRWNRRVVDVTGYSPEELLNKSALAFVPPEEQTRTAAAIQRAFTEGYAELDGLLLTKDFRIIPYHWTGALLKSPQGEPIGITGVGRDVSEKKRAENELRQQRRHLIDAQALAHLGSWYWDVDTGEEQWSDEQFRIFGYEPGAMAVTYDTFLASLHQDDRDPFVAAINDALIGKHPVDVECRVVRPDGEVRFIHARGNVHRNATGHPLSMAGTVQDITERKRAEVALQESESRFRNLFEQSPIAYQSLDITGRFIDVNDKLCDLLGYSREELIGRGFDEVWADECAPMFPDKFDLFKRQHQITTDLQLVKKTGEMLTVVLAGRIQRDKKGNFLRTHCILTDITERKRTEEALRDRETAQARFKSTLDQTHDCVFMFDPDSLYFSYCNQGAVKQVGYSEAELLTMTPLDIKPEFTEQTFREMLLPLRDGRMASLVSETGHRHKDGHDVPVEVSLQLVGEEGGEGRFVAVVRDITYRRHAEEALRASEARFRMLVEETTDWMWETDEQGRYTYSSPKIRDLLGYEPEEALGKTPFDFMPEEEARRVADLFGPIAAARKQFSGIENTNRHKDGRLVVFECRGVPIIDAKGLLRGYRGFDQDITERKQAEEKLRLSEQRQELALSGANLGLWDWDIPSGKTLFDARWCAMVGYSVDELEPHVNTWRSLLHQEDGPRVQSILELHLKNEAPSYEVEFRMRHKAGHWVWILARGRVVERDQAGVPLRMAGTHMDITEHKQAEEALIFSERQLRTVLDALPVGVWFTDQSGKPVLSNPAAKQIWSGIKQVGVEAAADATGWWEPVGPSDTFHRWALSHALTKGVPSLNETLDFECLDGAKKTIRNTTVPVQDEAGVVLGAIVLNEDITTLRQAQESLKLTQFSVNHAVEGFLWIDSDARILNVNNAACRMLQYTRDELMTMALYDIDPNLPPGHWSDRWNELKQKGSVTFESKYWSQTGRVLDMEVTASYLGYEGKEYSCAIMRDIGERKRAEASLRQSEERYRSLVDNAPIGIFVNEGGRFVYANREMQRILNVTNVEQLVGTSVFERIAPEFYNVVMDRIHELMENGQPVPSLDEQFVRLDGSRVDVSVTAIPTSFDGTPMMQVLVLDITERKRAEVAIRRSHAFLRQIIDIYPNFIFAKDRAGRFTLANQAVADAYGISVDQLIGKTDADFNPNPFEVEFFRLKDLEVMDSLQERVISEEVITDSAGRTRWLQTVKRPICDEEGRAIMTLGAATDITERKRMEETLRQREQDLRAAIGERERISQDLHDGILQSLFAVGLTLETTKSMMSPRTRKKSGAPLDQAIDQLNRVMHEIRNFIAGLGSDLLRGKDLPAALQQMLGSLTQHHAMPVRLAIDDRAVQALSVEQSQQLLLIIQEAVSNCVRHGHAQEAKVSLKLLKQGIRLSVRDNGSGFKLKTSNRTGHGLTNMAARAKRMGGRFTIMSKVNEGTRIEIDLPKEVSRV